MSELGFLNGKGLEDLKVSVKPEEVLKVLLEPAKKGRKAFNEMSDDELYKAYCSKCEKQKHPILDRKTWEDFQLMYDWDDLLTSEDVEINNPRNRKESKATKLGYLGEDLDMHALNRLIQIIFAAIQRRIAIIYNLEDVPSLINRAYQCKFEDCDCSSINAIMNEKIAECKRINNDKQVKEWIALGNTDLVFCDKDNLSNTLTYIESYQKMLRKLTGITGIDLEYIRPIIHNNEDLFEDEIIANNIPDFENCYESNSEEDEFED